MLCGQCLLELNQLSLCLDLLTLDRGMVIQLKLIQSAAHLIDHRLKFLDLQATLCLMVCQDLRVSCFLSLKFLPEFMDHGLELPILIKGVGEG